jgi:hypothetical protein
MEYQCVSDVAHPCASMRLLEHNKKQILFGLNHHVTVEISMEILKLTGDPTEVMPDFINQSLRE